MAAVLRKKESCTFFSVKAKYFSFGFMSGGTVFLAAGFGNVIGNVS